MSDPSPSRLQLWRERFQRLLSRARAALPFVAGMLAALLGLFLYNALTPKEPQLTIDDVNTTVAEAMAAATPAPAYSAQVYQMIAPSMVLIQTEFSGENGQTERALGSGVVIDQMGSILTSLHVVDDATAIRLTFADGSESGAVVMVAQPENDIAVLAPTEPPDQVIPAILGNPGAMRVGDEAFVVGNPFGLAWSMSTGVVSGFDRTFQSPSTGENLQGLIQIDTAVNPGNSGGPLLNRYGHVVGIVVGILNPTEQEFFIGIGFAVPINVAGGAAGSPPY